MKIILIVLVFCNLVSANQEYCSEANPENCTLSSQISICQKARSMDCEKIQNALKHMACKRRVIGYLKQCRIEMGNAFDTEIQERNNTLEEKQLEIKTAAEKHIEQKYANTANNSVNAQIQKDYERNYALNKIADLERYVKRNLKFRLNKITTSADSLVDDLNKAATQSNADINFNEKLEISRRNIRFLDSAKINYFNEKKRLMDDLNKNVNGEIIKSLKNQIDKMDDVLLQVNDLRNLSLKIESEIIARTQTNKPNTKPKENTHTIMIKYLKTEAHDRKFKPDLYSPILTNNILEQCQMLGKSEYAECLEATR